MMHALLAWRVLFPGRSCASGLWNWQWLCKACSCRSTAADIASAMLTAGLTHFSGKSGFTQAVRSTVCGTCLMGQDALPMQWACSRDHAVLGRVGSNCGSSR